MIVDRISIPIGQKVQCVYRMEFDTGHFYIGATINLKYRMTAWKNMLRSPKTINPTINKKWHLFSSAKFSIVEYVDDVAEVKFRETFHLSKYDSDPMCLNVDYCSKKKHRVSMSKGEIIESQILKGIIHRVGEYTTDGVLTRVHRTMRDAAGSKGALTGIQKVIRGKQSSYKNRKYAKLNLDLSPIPIPECIPKKKGRPKGYSMSPETLKKIKSSRSTTIKKMISDGVFNASKRVAISQYDMDGNFIKTYSSVREAADNLNTNTANICKVLKGSRKSNRGFLFKYA